jgi:hypothetical protein
MCTVTLRTLSKLWSLGSFINLHLVCTQARFEMAYVWQAIEDHHRAHSNGLGVSAILDVGCSTGESTQALAAGFPDAKLVVGL